MIVEHGGRRHEARVVERSAGAARVEVDGRTFEIGVVPLAPNVFRVQVDGRTETVHCVAEGGTIHVFWRGRAYVLERAAAAAAVRALAPPGTYEAPMPGRVVAVKVQAGDRVSKGQPLLVIEAMKMETALRAEQDGVVRTVAVAEGDRVVPGQPLVELS